MSGEFIEIYRRRAVLIRTSAQKSHLIGPNAVAILQLKFVAKRTLFVKLPACTLLTTEGRLLQNSWALCCADLLNLFLLTGSFLARFSL